MVKINNYLILYNLLSPNFIEDYDNLYLISCTQSTIAKMYRVNNYISSIINNDKVKQMIQLYATTPLNEGVGLMKSTATSHSTVKTYTGYTENIRYKTACKYYFFDEM